MGQGNICQTGDGYYQGFAIYEALTINDIISNCLETHDVKDLGK